MSGNRKSDHESYFVVGPSTGEMVFYSLLLINSILFTLKIMFEFQLSINKITNITETINVIINFFLIVAKLVEIIMKNNYEVNFNNDQEFQDM